MARYFLITGISLLGLLISLVVFGRYEPSFTVLQGNYAYYRGEYVKATILYLGLNSKWKETKLNERYFQYNIANTYLSVGELEAGINQLLKIDKGLEDKKLIENALFNLGNAHYEIGEYLKSAEYFRDVLEINPGAYDAKINLEISLKKIRAGVISQEKDTQLNAAQAVRILEFVRRHQKPIAPNIPPSGHGDSY